MQTKKQLNTKNNKLMRYINWRGMLIEYERKNRIRID